VSGTGHAIAREFAKEGYCLALIGRTLDHLKTVGDEIKAAGGDAAPFPITAYDGASLHAAFASIRTQWPGCEIRGAIWNASGPFVRKPFLELTEKDMKDSFDAGVVAAFAFAKEAIAAIKDNALDKLGKRGTLIFTGATASLRGNVGTATLATAKFAVRALSQSLNKEFGKQNIHVAHAVIDGVILTGRTKGFLTKPGVEADEAKSLSPDSIAKSYLYLVNQDQSAWTWELDLRPAHETW